MDEAIAVALSTNRSIATAVEALERAGGRQDEAAAALRPTVTANGTVTELDSPFVIGFGGQSFTAQNAFNPVLNAAIALPLDIGGALRAAVSQADFQKIATKIDINRARNEVVLSVKSSFYNVLRAQAQVRVSHQNVLNALSRFSDAQKNYAAGTAPRFDVITSQTDVANAQQAEIQATSQVDVALAILKNTLGVSMSSPIKITDAGAVQLPAGVEAPVPPVIHPGSNAQEINPPVPNAAPITPPDTALNVPLPPAVDVGPNNQPIIAEDTLHGDTTVAALIDEALKTRPEIMEADASLTAARKGVQVARRSSLPALNLSLGYTYAPNAAAFQPQKQGQVALGLSVPIFDGGLAHARVREARADVSTAETERRQMADQVSLDVQQAYLNLVQARYRVAVANVGISQARESYRLARVRYSAGVSQQPGLSPQLEVSNAEAALAQAEANQVNAIYDYNTARAQLDHAVGRYAFTGASPGLPSPQAKPGH
jgi:outer membrane protein TolC